MTPRRRVPCATTTGPGALARISARESMWSPYQLLMGRPWLTGSAGAPPDRSASTSRRGGDRVPEQECPPLIVYHRPGCPFAVKLRAQLTLARVPHRSVTFRQDRRAAAAVRRHNGGYETSPTVLVGDSYLANPSLREVRQARATIAQQHLGPARHPHALPPGDLR